MIEENILKLQNTFELKTKPTIPKWAPKTRKKKIAQSAFMFTEKR